MTTAPDAIRALYPEWMIAVRDKDVAALDRVVARDFRYTDNIQGHKRRKAWMQAALAHEIVRQDGRLRGETRSGEWLITDAWHRSGGRWQVVARSAILKPAAPGTRNA